MFTVYYPLVGRGNQGRKEGSSGGSLVGKQLTSKPSEGSRRPLDLLPGPRLSVQLVYYRGLSECRASKGVSQPEQLSGLMERIDCRMGHTQLGKVLAHARRETELLKVQALVFVGDALEETRTSSATTPASSGV